MFRYTPLFVYLYASNYLFTRLSYDNTRNQSLDLSFFGHMIHPPPMTLPEAIQTFWLSFLLSPKTVFWLTNIADVTLSKTAINKRHLPKK